VSCYGYVSTADTILSPGGHMATEATLSVEERLYRLLRHLGVDQAHFAGWMPQDWAD